LDLQKRRKKMGTIPRKLLGAAALFAILLLTPGFTGVVSAENQQVSGVVSSVQDYVVVVDNVEYVVTATSKLVGADHNHLEAIEGHQVQITYTEFNGQNRVVELTVS